MPQTKNAIFRYKYLDKLLSDRMHYYDIHDLTDICNERLREEGYPEVSQRCIEKDLVFMECAPFSADIDRFRVNGRSCLRYRKASFSIFKEELTDEESNLLVEVLNTIGQFDGLNNFDWMNRMMTELNLKKRPKVISFSKNPYLKNSNMLGTLFDYISNRVVVKLSYHTFSCEVIRSIVFHPYLLKQYNNRWFLLGAADTDKKILTFAIDRLDGITPLPEYKYYKCTHDLEERFEDIVGVTLYKDRPVEHIVCWVSDASKDYIITKPIHESQKQIRGDEENILRAKFSNLHDGVFFSIDCISNYELIRELCSFGGKLLVISPEHIQEKICSVISEMGRGYSSIGKFIKT